MVHGVTVLVSWGEGRGWMGMARRERSRKAAEEDGGRVMDNMMLVVVAVAYCVLKNINNVP